MLESNPEQNEQFVNTLETTKRDSGDIDEGSKGSIISQYESGSFMSKEFFEESRDNMSTDYEPRNQKKRNRRRRPQI